MLYGDSLWHRNQRRNCNDREFYSFPFVDCNTRRRIFLGACYGRLVGGLSGRLLVTFTVGFLIFISGIKHISLLLDIFTFLVMLLTSAAFLIVAGLLPLRSRLKVLETEKKEE